MSVAIQIEPSRLRVLLVGSQGEDFFLLRDILNRNHDALPVALDHARSPNGRDLTQRLRIEAELLQSQKMDAIGQLAGA